MSKKPKSQTKPPVPSSGGSYVAESGKLTAVAGPKAKPVDTSTDEQKGS
jgi:hypothetical protein